MLIENQQRQILKNHYIYNMDGPSEINSVYWHEKTKSWKYKVIKIEEYHGFVECQHCRKPMSHNVKSDGEYKVVYVKCGCARDG